MTKEEMVIRELDRLHEDMEKINSSLIQLHTEVAMLKVKSGIWGAISGVVVFTIAFFIEKIAK